jgi:putative transposase
VKRAEVRRLQEEFSLSERHACELMTIPRTTLRWVSRKDDSALRERLTALAHEHPRFGYRRLHILLERAGEKVNHKKVQRVYRAAGLCVRRIRRKRLTRVALPRPELTAPEQEWAIDFISDVAASGQRLRIFSVVDAFTRECLALEVDTSMPSRRVTRVLQKLVEQRGKPQAIRSDNGPEYTSRHYLAWCAERGIGTAHIQPGRPTQNGKVESFHGRFRDECLNASWFWNLWDARKKIASWRQGYNLIRPHSALGYRPPDEFAQLWRKAAPPSDEANTARTQPNQGQALRVPSAALTTAASSRCGPN